jgi:hypothetical protein
LLPERELVAKLRAFAVADLRSVQLFGISPAPAIEQAVSGVFGANCHLRFA